MPCERTLHRHALNKRHNVQEGDTVYFPSEIWSEMGVKPFADAPEVTVPESQPKPVALIHGDGAHSHEDFAF